MVPTDRRSSVSYPDCWYFLTTCATSRRFRLISTSLASRSPSLQRLKYSRSSCALSGFGNVFKESRLKLHYFILCGGRAAGAFTSFPYFLRLRPAHIPALFPVSGRCPSPHRLSALSACKGIKVIVSVPHTAQNQSCYFFLYGTVLLPEVLPVSPPEPLQRSHIPELRLIPFLFCACWNIV